MKQMNINFIKDFTDKIEETPIDLLDSLNKYFYDILA